MSWICDGRPDDAPPLAVTEAEGNALRLAGLEPGAARFGLAAGQTLADARALCPALDVAPRAPEAEAATLAAIAAWCDRYTPLVGRAGADGLALDIAGCAHLWGGEAALTEELTTRLTAQGFHVRAAVADTAGAAWALARHAPGTVAAPGETAAALAPLPVAALRLDAGVAAALTRLGLKTVGCLAELPRAPLARRFGAEALRRLDLALGRAEETISPLVPTPGIAAERRFAEPVALEADLRAVVALLAPVVAERLAARGAGARRLELRLYRVDGHVERLEVAAAQPLRAPERIAALFAERLAGLRREIEGGYGFDMARLCVTGHEPWQGRQGDIEGARAEDGAAALIDRLGARLGSERVRGFAAADTHIPERAFGTVALARLAPGAPAAGPAGRAPVPPLSRPLLLLARPEPVAALAEVPDGPPRRFRWRRAEHRVARAEGPERIACEWWRDGRAAPTRDYFRVEDADGRRFWMFRHGLYARETPRPRWYMHGVFA